MFLRSLDIYDEIRHLVNKNANPNIAWKNTVRTDWPGQNNVIDYKFKAYRQPVTFTNQDFRKLIETMTTGELHPQAVICPGDIKLSNIPESWEWATTEWENLTQ